MSGMCRCSHGISHHWQFDEEGKPIAIWGCGYEKEMHSGGVWKCPCAAFDDKYPNSDSCLACGCWQQHHTPATGHGSCPCLDFVPRNPVPLEEPVVVQKGHVVRLKFTDFRAKTNMTFLRRGDTLEITYRGNLVGQLKLEDVECPGGGIEAADIVPVPGVKRTIDL